MSSIVKRSSLTWVPLVLSTARAFLVRIATIFHEDFGAERNTERPALINDGPLKSGVVVNLRILTLPCLLTILISTKAFREGPRT